MEFWVQIKTIGKRKMGLEKVKYHVPIKSNQDLCVDQFIASIVKEEIASYQKRAEQTGLFSILSGQEIAAELEAGKVSFGGLYHYREVDEKKAIHNALQCFEDGLVRIFQNEEALESLNQCINISSDDVFTFVRLTFLAGRLY